MCWVRVQRVPCPATHPLSVHAWATTPHIRGRNSVLPLPHIHGLFTARAPSAATYDDLAHDDAGASVTRSIHQVRGWARLSESPRSDG